MTQIPRWAQDLYERMEAGTSPLFVLHHNIADYVPLGEAFLAFPHFLTRWLCGASPVIVYNRSTGLRFPDEETERRFRKAAGLRATVAPDQREAHLEEQKRRALVALGEATAAEPPPLPTHPTKVVPLIGQALRSGGLRDRRRHAIVVLEYAESIAPAADFSCMNEDDRTNLVALLSLSTDLAVQEQGGVLLLTVSNLADLHPTLRHPGGRVEVIEVPLPDEAERLQYIAHLLAQDGLRLSMTAEELARATAGLTRLHLEQLCRQAKAKASPLTFAEIKQRKREILRQELYGMVELVEPSFGLEVIGGLKGVKQFFREVIQAIRDGDLKMVPRGITLVGPPGVGKTAVAEALAKECGFNFVKITNPREKWVGASERNFWKILQALRSLTPLVVLEDEADQSEPSRDEFSGDSGVTNRLRQMRFEFTGDPTIQGRVLWIRISNRPDKLDPAERRSGRFSERIPLLMPDADERIAIFAVMSKKHGFATTAVDFASVVALCEERFPEQITGADIEEISLRAYRRARVRGSDAVAEEDYRWAIEDFIPSQSAELIRRQELMALAHCSSRRFLPERYRDIRPEEYRSLR
ncbi:MAG: AAA family ATPase [Candidatus Methylomirabilales bacterium]